MIVITLQRSPGSAGDGPLHAVTIPDEHGPALRSAIAEIRNELGERASGAHSYDKEDAIVRAISALAALASAINAVIPHEDPDYDG